MTMIGLRERINTKLKKYSTIFARLTMSFLEIKFNSMAFPKQYPGYNYSNYKNVC